MTALAHALDLAKRGRAVFPMNPSTKRPACPHGLKDATRDPEIIRGWFIRPGLVPAVATGEPSGVVALDVDRQHGGLGWWTVYRQRLPATEAYRTKSGGLHLIFQNAPGIRTITIGAIGDGVELRATGASAIYWPSAGFPILSDARPAVLPQWLIPPPKPAYVPSDAPPRVADDAAIDRLIRFVAQAGHGERNARLYWAGCRMRELAATGTLSRRAAIEILTETGSRIGLDRNEAHRTARSAIEGGRS
jgi:hypothetical protein